MTAADEAQQAPEAQEVQQMQREGSGISDPLNPATDGQSPNELHGEHSVTDAPAPPAPAAPSVSLLLGDDDDWRQYANCASSDPEPFFPDKGGSTREAKKRCGQRLVRAECLTWAMHTDQRFGIWGGLSERQRRHLKQLSEEGSSRA
jgi:WhiB family redox-sensing transcriptional regulator